MKTITIKDERITQVVPVALEEIKAEITETENMTTPLEISGVKIEGTFTTTKSLGITTLKDTDAEVSNLTIYLAEAQQRVVDLTTEVQNKNNTRTELEPIVQKAFDDLQIAIAAKPVEPTPIEIIK